MTPKEFYCLVIIYMTAAAMAFLPLVVGFIADAIKELFKSKKP